MSDERTPWWYSGDETPEPEPIDEAPGAADDDAAAAPEPALDWGVLLAGAARMVDWATSTVMAPHAEHGDPADHPQCVVCRGILLVGSAGAPLGADAPPAEPPAHAPGRTVEWIPVRDAAEG